MPLAPVWALFGANMSRRALANWDVKLAHGCYTGTAVMLDVVTDGRFADREQTTANADILEAMFAKPNAFTTATRRGRT